MSSSRIIRHLYQGSLPGAGFPLPFDLVVLCAGESQFDPKVYGQRPFGARARVLRVPLTDGGMPLSPQNAARAYAAATDVASTLSRGERVLVTCYLGLNRSGIVNALALLQLGWRAQEAVALIKAARPNALHNAHFVQLVYNIGGRSLFRVPLNIQQGALCLG